MKGKNIDQGKEKSMLLPAFITTEKSIPQFLLPRNITQSFAAHGFEDGFFTFKRHNNISGNDCVE
jgi:hypothetical protein